MIWTEDNFEAIKEDLCDSTRPIPIGDLIRQIAELREFHCLVRETFGDVQVIDGKLQCRVSMSTICFPDGIGGLIAAVHADKK